MAAFSVSDFFDLSAFSHASLFDDCTYVWGALDKIGAYLAKQSLGNSYAAHQEYASNARSSISFQTAKQPQLIFINGCRAKLPSKPIED